MRRRRTLGRHDNVPTTNATSMGTVTPSTSLWRREEVAARSNSPAVVVVAPAAAVVAGRVGKTRRMVSVMLVTAMVTATVIPC